MNRFFNKVEKTNYCWNWIGSLSSNGYGNFYYNSKVDGSHRVSYILHKGNIPLGMFVCHHCDNPKCVNPDHLFLGTNSDNMLDCSMKGRLNGAFKTGHKALNSILSDEQVLNIKYLISIDKKIKDISTELNVNYESVKSIKYNKTYKSILYL